MRLHEQYTKEVHDELNYLATWLPTVKVEPGDVCTIADYQLQPVSTLKEFGIPFEVEEVGVDTNIDYSSKGAVQISLKAAGDPPPTGSVLSVQDAGITVSFGRENAVLLRLANCTSRRIKNLHNVGQRVMALHAAGQWPDGYVVIAQSIQAGASTIIISKSAKAAIDLVAKVGVGQGQLTVASLDAGLQVKRESDIGARFVAAAGLTPLAVTAGVRKRFLRKDDFRGATVPSPVDFGEVSYDDFAVAAR